MGLLDRDLEEDEESWTSSVSILSNSENLLDVVMWESFGELLFFPDCPFDLLTCCLFRLISTGFVGSDVEGMGFSLSV